MPWKRKNTSIVTARPRPVSIRSGTSGLRALFSTARKTRRRTPPAASAPTVRDESQPLSGPVARPKTSRVEPTGAMSAPGRSKEVFGPVARASAPSRRGAARTAIRASGTLT
ncbi:hypothetical protein [Streptomyces sp. NPDC058664]|uniref:hypothetical protein n=1 Tax=unclassified Streptomyces TaxID=2593676 RepID=UPI00365DED81